MGTRVGAQISRRSASLLAVAWLLVAARMATGADRPEFKPGFNLFSPQQDVQVGREAVEEVEKQLPLLTDARVVSYVNELGRRLASFAPNNNSDYAWSFKVVDSSEINAFALPGGFIYVNRGALEAAENEAQLAGVLAHESGHVVMRHGTHQATEVMLAQFPLALLSGLLGQSGSLAGQLAQAGINFGVGSLMLRNSRSAESQADQVGTYILYQAGYDPHAMANFFQIIEKKYPQQTIQFFSDHPNPENRIQNVDEEIPRLGPARSWSTDSPAFEAVKKRLLNLPPPPKQQPSPKGPASPSPPPPPSNHLVKFETSGFALKYPDNWEVQKGEGAVALFPKGAMVAGSEGGSAQAYGASISWYQPQSQGQSGWGLIDATQQLLDSLRQSNPNLRVVEQAGISVRGQPALSTLLENDSPLPGQKEKDRLVTLRQGNSLLTLIFIAPESSFDAYKPAFDAMLQSLELF